jgi:hypothetical protein
MRLSSASTERPSEACPTRNGCASPGGPGLPRRPGAVAVTRLRAHAPAGRPRRVRKGGRVLSYFSPVTTLGTPQDAMLQEIRLESFFPADETTAAHYW